MGTLQAEGRQVQRCRAGAHWVFKDKRLERMEQRGRAGQRREARLGWKTIPLGPTGRFCSIFQGEVMQDREEWAGDCNSPGEK